MEQSSEGSLSVEEMQLARTHHLGRVLKVYHLSPRALRAAYVWDILGTVMCVSVGLYGLFTSLLEIGPSSGVFLLMRIGVCLLFGGGVVVALVDAKHPHVMLKVLLLVVLAAPLFVTPLAHWPWELGFQAFLALVCFAGGVLIFAARRDARKTRLLVCDGGLLKAKKISWYTQIDVIYWTDISLPASSFTPTKYRLFDQGKGKLMVIAAVDHQQGQELLALLKEQLTGEIGRRQTTNTEERWRQDHAYWIEHGEWPVHTSSPTDRIVRWLKILRRFSE